jgi:hypothetical protein
LTKTRVVRLRTGKIRQDALNAVTMVVHPGEPIPGEEEEASFEELFLRHYEHIREICDTYDKQGIAAIAVDSNGVAGSVCLSAKPDRINAAIVGRHGMTDLYLDGDPSLSLRHMVVLLHPGQPDCDVRFRLLDLRTAVAFKDERDRRLEALEAEGPVFIRCGAYAIFLFPTGDEIPWPDRGHEGWDCIPERVYLDDEPAEPDRWERRRLRSRWQLAGGSEAGERRGITRVQTFRGPVLAHRRLLEDGEEPLGELRIRSETGTTSISIGRRAAREGVLLGRYDRCDNEGLPVLENVSISRVHTLVVEIAGRLYAVDTASTNGAFADGKEFKVLPLEYDQELVMGENLATVRWCVVN